MQTLSVFNNVTLDGYFAGVDGDISWAHQAKPDPEWNAFVADNASSSGGTLLFGRKTYEIMASYWPTPLAMKHDPKVAEGINKMPKVVFSKTLSQASWNNTRIVKSGIADEVRRMKESGEPMTILGSGSIVSQLTQDGLIDEYQVVVHPIVLGRGRTMFEGIKEMMALKLSKTRAFGNGNVVLWYQTAA